MSMTPDLWREVRARLNQYPNVYIAGSVLTRVQYRIDEQGNRVGVIPKWVQDDARKYGLCVTYADYQKDRYEVCLLTSTN